MFLQLILILGASVTSTLAQADADHLNDEILPICFETPTFYNGELYVNGQKEPLASSMDNFISLVEKMELANPDMKLEDQLFILLKNYTADNVYFHQTAKYLAIWKPSPAEMGQFLNMWEPNTEKLLPVHVDPFEKNEKCSLFFMLSHTVNETARPNIDPAQKSYSPSPNEVHHSSVMKSHIPREQGVVAVNRSKAHAVALGRVLLGLYVGLKNKNDRIKPLDSYTLNTKMNLDQIQSVDTLYLVTLADQLIISQFPLEESAASKGGLGGNGAWEYVKFPPVGRTFDFPICPVVYELPENNTSAYTFSSVRGGVDGLILGEVIRDIHNSQPNVRLSQILRMYYGRNGLQERSGAPPSDEVISFCKRIDKMAPKEKFLKDQMRVFLALVSRLPNSEDTYTKAIGIYDSYKKSIMMPNGEVEKDCRLLDESKGVPKCESAIDVIFVVDTTPKSDGSDLETQREIIGHLANHLDMAYEGSTMTVFSDQRNGTSGLDLITLISNTTSSACAACSATQFQLDTTPQAEKEFIIRSIGDVLKNVEEEEKLLNGARGKVVIFFNFQEEETVSYQLKRALRDLYMRHVGVQFFAVGNNKEVLKIYAQGQSNNVLSVLGMLPRETADTLALKICEVPSKLQYDDCKNGRNEASAVYEGLISSNSLQRWAMYPKYFYKSLTPKMFFQSDRQIEVCHSRAYSRAENEISHCQKTNPSGGRIEFNQTNPCRAFNDHNCSPWYFTVAYVEGNSNGGLVPEKQYCQDTPNSLRCKTLDQVKFRVSHEGIRCSSCSGLFSTPVLLIACFATYILTKFMSIDV